MGLMKRLIKIRSSKLKVLITFATLDGEKVSDFFSKCPILNVPRKLFPVEILYSAEQPKSYIESSLRKAIDIHVNEPEGDILIFMTGQVIRTGLPLNKSRPDPRESQDFPHVTESETYSLGRPETFSTTGKRSLWSYITSLITRWNSDCMVMGDFNEVRCMEDRMGSVFNVQRANEFNNFVSNSRLVKVQLEGYSFTWSHSSATKMSKLDRFLVTEGLVSLFPYISGICLDRHLSDHRPILLREVITDYGATPFRMYHSWFSLHGFEQMVTHTWNYIVLDDRNGMVRFKKKMQFLKKEIRVWVMDQNQKQSGRIKEIKSKLSDIDRLLDQRGVNDEILLSRMDLLKQMQYIKSSDARDCMQKSKIQWAIERDENFKFFHGIINQKRVNLAIKGVMVDGEWMDDPSRVKEEFRSHFATRFQAPGVNRSRLNFRFPYRLNPDQVAELENLITRDEICNVVRACGENKSPGPDGFIFEFFRKFWNIIGSDLCVAVEWFFDHSSFTKGCNSSFVALISKTHDPKFVSDYRPISLIGSLYKVATKILATRLSMVISDLILDVQTAFLPNRQILMVLL
nr:RNA-directed DNA polymerase, eukaryota [Tanacetum cinerariifolium]